MKLLFTTCIAFFALSLFAQESIENPTVQLVLEEQDIPLAIKANIEVELQAEPTSYRLYTEVSQFWELQFVFGIDGQVLSLSAENSFYQHPEGGPTSLNINPSFFVPFPELEFDSWLTIGAEEEDGNLMIVVPSDFIFNDWEAGNDLSLGGLFGSGLFVATTAQIEQNYPDSEGRILLGQFTVGAPLQGCLNLQFRRLNPDGSLYIVPGTDNETITYIDQFCFSSQTSPACLVDLDGSGTVDAGDVLIFLANFGCFSNCQVDFNGDGATTAADLLVLLAAFGESCE